MILDERAGAEDREKGGGSEDGGGDEEVGAREKSDAVKHSAGRVIRLRKSAGSTLLHYRVTILPTLGYIFIHNVTRAWPKTLNACFVPRLASKTREFPRQPHVIHRQ